MTPSTCQGDDSQKALSRQLSQGAEHGPQRLSSIREALRRPIIVFGAGRLGQSVARGLRLNGARLIAFADNAPHLWGKSVDDLPVLSPKAAALEFGSTTTFVIAVWHPARERGIGQISRQLGELNCQSVVPFAQVFWCHPDTFLPYFFWDLPSRILSEADDITSTLALLADDCSRQEFVAQTRLRITGAFASMPPLADHPQYFADFIRPHPHECFVDCGAYDGDSIRSFLEWTSGHANKIIAFEADPACFFKLQSFVGANANLVPCQLHPCAVAARNGTFCFDGTGLANARISDQGAIQVQGVTLDSMLKYESPTFIKMDIEGSEMDALHGATETIRRTRPVVAACIYHRPSDLWKIPAFLKDIYPEANLYLRSYCLDGLDTVCYAVPSERIATCHR